MSTYSGLYLHYEGTEAQCNATQQQRELVFDTTSGMLRYLDTSGTYRYAIAGDHPHDTYLNRYGVDAYAIVNPLSGNVTTTINASGTPGLSVDGPTGTVFVRRGASAGTADPRGDELVVEAGASGVAGISVLARELTPAFCMLGDSTDPDYYTVESYCTPVDNAYVTHTVLDTPFVTINPRGTKKLLLNPSSGNVDTAINGSGNTALFVQGSGAYVAVGHRSPDRPFHQEYDAGSTSGSIQYLQRLSAVNTVTSASGFGLGQEYELRHSATSGNFVAARQSVRWLNLTWSCNSEWQLDTMYTGVLSATISANPSITTVHSTVLCANSVWCDSVSILEDNGLYFGCFKDAYPSSGDWRTVLTSSALANQFYNGDGWLSPFSVLPSSVTVSGALALSKTSVELADSGAQNYTPTTSRVEFSYASGLAGEPVITLQTGSMPEGSVLYCYNKQAYSYGPITIDTVQFFPYGVIQFIKCSDGWRHVG